MTLVVVVSYRHLVRADAVLHAGDIVVGDVLDELRDDEGGAGRPAARVGGRGDLRTEAGCGADAAAGGSSTRPSMGSD